jgi:hypothetical protein
MMLISKTICLVCVLMGLLSVAQASEFSPNRNEKIAAQQGRFGALYARCGTRDEKIVIGGTIDSWKKETFMGFRGTPSERAHVEKIFDDAAEDIFKTQNSCQGWIKHAAVVWHSLAELSQG